MHLTLVVLVLVDLILVVVAGISGCGEATGACCHDGDEGDGDGEDEDADDGDRIVEKDDHLLADGSSLLW